VPKDKILVDAKRIPGNNYFVIAKHDLLTDKKPLEFIKQLLAPVGKQ
jgi:hypothetical protein